MGTRKISDDRPGKETQPVSSFGTSPELAALLKPTNYDGTLLKDRYLIEGELGRGGVGVVYLARDTQLLQRRVVIKILLQESEESLHTPWFKKKFEQELEALVRLDHPSIVGALDAGAMPDGKLFLVMQFVEGATLRSLMKDEFMDLARVAGIVRQIGAALSAAHDKGVVHRDLKPENVMAQTLSGGEELIKLIDFGIATVKDSQAATSAERTKVAGALPYMAPEQLRGQPEITSDIWALGVIAYELVTGRLPFTANTMVQLYESQRKGPEIEPSRFRGDLPAAAERAILKALSFDPSERFARAKDLGDELARALTEATALPGQFAPGEQVHAFTPYNYEAGDPLLLAKTQKEATPMTASNAPTKVGPLDGSPPENARAQKPPAIPGKLIAATAVAVLAVIAAIWYVRLNDSTRRDGGGQQSSPTPIAPSRSLNYSLRVRAKGPDQKPVELSHEVIFTPGDELCFIFDSPQAGYIYIINEGPNKVNGLPQYNFLFPNPKSVPANLPSLKANQPLFVPSEQPPWFPVDNEKGKETQWMVWSDRPVTQMEKVKKWLNEKDLGEIKDAEDIRMVSQFLSQSYSAAAPVAEKGRRQTHLKGGKDGLLVYPMEVEHR
ncbi:MAG: protein kinase domain-containing protein [Blastocatellia bacterium]